MNDPKQKRTVPQATFQAGDGPPDLLSPLATWSAMLDWGLWATAITQQVLQAQRASLDMLAGGREPRMAPAGARLTLRDIYDCVAAAGYQQISEIEWEGDHYEVEAHDAHGRAVELRVRGDDGAIEHAEFDD